MVGRLRLNASTPSPPQARPRGSASAKIRVAVLSSFLSDSSSVDCLVAQLRASATSLPPGGQLPSTRTLMAEHAVGAGTEVGRPAGSSPRACWSPKRGAAPSPPAGPVASGRPPLRWRSPGVILGPGQRTGPARADRAVLPSHRFVVHRVPRPVPLRQRRRGPRGGAHVLAETIARVRAASSTGALLVRADSGFYDSRFIACCRRATVGFSVTARNDAAVTRAIAAIPDDAWQPIPSPGSGGGIASCARILSALGRRRRGMFALPRVRSWP